MINKFRVLFSLLHAKNPAPSIGKPGNVLSCHCEADFAGHGSMGLPCHCEEATATAAIHSLAVSRKSFATGTRGNRVRRFFNGPFRQTIFGHFCSTNVKAPAFSLVEMLMALLVASLLLAALAPVMTRKFGESLNVAGATGGGRAPATFKCWDYESPELQLATDGTNQKILPEDFAIDDAWYVNFIIASGGGGGAGATASVTADDTYSEPETGYSDGIKITYDMDEFDIELMTGAGGGAGGGAAISDVATCTGSASEDKCECMGTYYDAQNKVCVTDKQGEDSYANAKTICKALNPASKWTPPTMTQLGKWKTQLDDIGISDGETVWSSNTGSYCSAYQSGYIAYYAYGSGCGTTGCGSGSSCPSGIGSSYGSYGCYSTSDAASSSSRIPSTCTSKSYSSTSCVTTLSSLQSTCNNSYGGYISSATSTSCCKTKKTTYRFYTRSGASWSASPNNSTTTSSAGPKSVYCVYKDSGSLQGIKVYSISGGGGGSSPSIKAGSFDSSIKEVLNSKIKENIGGYIVLEIGAGGKGGSGSTAKLQKAKDGKKGGDSCISVKDSFKNDKYKVCVPGGNPGTGGDASQSDSLTNGYGRGGEEIVATNSCYTIDYTSNSAGEKTVFNCSEPGKAGGPGGAATTNPTPGGKGGASAKNPSSQVANSGKDGVTPNSTTNPGAGGGGGSTLKTGFGTDAVIAYGDGGDGADGYIKIKYKHKYEAAGGGGGGAGNIAHITNINVGKTATCSIRVGYGGSGGAAGENGYNGGDSSVSCSNAPTITYRVIGGKGGKIGTSAAGAGGTAIGGLGGEAGGYDNTGNVFTRLLNQKSLKMYEGETGIQGGLDESNYKIGSRSAGGRGGNNVSESGKCGALFNEEVGCKSVSTDENNNISEPHPDDLNGKGFSSGDIVTPTRDDVAEENPKYGKAGAGGGGGAWYAGKNPGSGGSGLGGYVCIYWDKPEE